MARRIKLVVYVPESHADKIREVMGKAGAGKIGNYTFCTFSTKGEGRFRPEKGAHPTLGELGKIEVVPEIKIESVCGREKLSDVIQAIKENHPYEEVALDVYPIEEI